MSTIFLSYSSQDYFFAEMLAIKLAENGFSIWRDAGSIRAGDDWRQSIEDGIRGCLAVVVALSAASVDSAYVTYEWAYAIGMAKPVVSVKLSACEVHPKLGLTQHIDFSYPRALPWDKLIDRLKEVEAEPDPITQSTVGASQPLQVSAGLDDAADAILGYLNERGFTRASFERLRQGPNLGMTDRQFRQVIDAHPKLFEAKTLKGPKPGLAKRVP